jgi:type 1 glutamine amidotransferase
LGALVALSLLSASFTSVRADEKDASKKKIVFIAGNPSHGFGAHDHKAGCMLLAKCLNESGLPVTTEVITNGWPKDESKLEGADCIVIYADGGGGHPANAHLATLDKLASKGVGVVCVHYGVEVPKGDSGDRFLDWIGGYFETHWSVNPHWTAQFKKFPDHPIAKGVKPFSINDEWYYHMRFRPEMKNVTPILSDLPPKETLNRGDGPHSGNPDVRKAVLEEKAPQHVAWAAEREGGGRGFGFTGGHVHWNWGNDNFRRLVLNAICWCAHVDVPSTGVPTKTLSVDDLLTNHDEPIPENFNKAGIEKMMAEWNAQ